MWRAACILGTVALAADADAWLVRHQNSDGSWGQGGATTRVTGLAVLAFLKIGYTDRDDDDLGIARSVRCGLRHLLRRQRRDGRIGDSALLDHAVATAALCDVWRMTKNPRYRQPAQRALRYLEGARLNDDGWRDPETVAHCVLAFRSGMRGGLEVDIAALAFVRRLTETWKKDARTAAVEILLGKRRKEAVERCLKNRPSRESIDMPFWFLGTRALYTKGGFAWRKWSMAMKDAIIDHQHAKGGVLIGSWDPSGRCSRAEATALMLLCLQIYYNYDTS